jgi:hypothetical protein
LIKLNLNIPKDEKKLYEQIILANHDVLGKTKDNLGKANNFKHKIFTKSDEQVFVRQYPIPEMLCEYLKKQVQEWLKLGIMQPSKFGTTAPCSLYLKRMEGLE